MHGPQFMYISADLLKKNKYIVQPFLGILHSASVSLNIIVFGYFNVLVSKEKNLKVLRSNITANVSFISLVLLFSRHAYMYGTEFKVCYDGILNFQKDGRGRLTVFF